MTNYASHVPLDPDDPRPPYIQVADHLRDAITIGRYKPGEQLPSRHQLAEEYAVSPMTVQNAMRELRGEGLIVSRQDATRHLSGDRADHRLSRDVTCPPCQGELAHYAQRPRPGPLGAASG